MATFKVGQRVRMARSFNVRDEYCVGMSGVITGIGPIQRDGEPSYLTDFAPRQVYGPCLEPLSDPRADAFIESIKRLKPYEEPKVEPRVVHTAFSLGGQ